MGNLLVGQSGGPTSVINSSLYGVISAAFESNSYDKILGMVNGIEGFLKESILDFDTITDEEIKLLRTTPGAYLGSCRYKLPENLSDDIYPEIFKLLDKYNISAFIYIGGNDSMDTVSKLSQHATQINSDIQFIGIPKTIDNDLVLTDHTPGFGSAAKFVASMVREISRDTSVYDRKTVTIIEIMGRNAGWLTASSVLARQFKEDNPVLIYLPESDFDEDAFINSIENAFKKKNNLTVCVSEGIHLSDGSLVCENTGDMIIDSFGHKIMNGCGKYLENLVRNRLNVKVRSVELNVAQRCASAYLSKTDVDEAEALGRFGITAALDGKTGCMTAVFRENSENYKAGYSIVDVTKVCNMEKCVPESWITKNGTDISDDFIKYALPLIQGFVEIPKKDGLPYFAYRKTNN